jgi:hypothetical protein
MQGVCVCEAGRGARCRPPSLPNRTHFDADSIDLRSSGPLAATPDRRNQRHEDDDVGRQHPALALNARHREVLHPPNPRVKPRLAADADTHLTAGTLRSLTGYCGASICWRPLKCRRFRRPRLSLTSSRRTIATWPIGRSPSSTNAVIGLSKRIASARHRIFRPKSCRCIRPRQRFAARWR